MNIISCNGTDCIPHFPYVLCSVGAEKWLWVRINNVEHALLDVFFCRHHFSVSPQYLDHRRSLTRFLSYNSRPLDVGSPNSRLWFLSLTALGIGSLVDHYGIERSYHKNDSPVDVRSVTRGNQIWEGLEYCRLSIASRENCNDVSSLQYCALTLYMLEVPLISQLEVISCFL